MQPSKVRKVSKAEARRAVKAHEKAMHGAKKMKAGGPTSLDMKKYGRGIAKVMNQRSAGMGR